MENLLQTKIFDRFATIDKYGETEEDIIIGEEQSRRKEDLFNSGWDIIDLLPAGRATELQKELIKEIIENGWDK